MARLFHRIWNVLSTLYGMFIPYNVEKFIHQHPHISFPLSFGYSFKNITEKVGLLVENPTFPVYLKSYCLSEACTQSKDQLATFVVHHCFRKINVIECIEIRLVHIIL